MGIIFKFVKIYYLFYNVLKMVMNRVLRALRAKLYFAIICVFGITEFMLELFT